MQNAGQYPVPVSHFPPNDWYCPYPCIPVPIMPFLIRSLDNLMFFIISWLMEKRPSCALGLLESDFTWITDPKVKYIIFS